MGNEPSAASGRYSEVSEWQRSKFWRPKCRNKILGTATGPSRPTEFYRWPIVGRGALTPPHDRRNWHVVPPLRMNIEPVASVAAGHIGPALQRGAVESRRGRRPKVSCSRGGEIPIGRPQGSPLQWGYGLPRQCVHWLAMTDWRGGALAVSYPK